MTALLIPPIYIHGVTRVNCLHDPRKVSSGSFDEQMVVGIHQGIAMKEVRIFFFGPSDDFQKPPSILVIKENYASEIPSRCNMVEGRIKKNSQLTSHGANSITHWGDVN